MFPCSPSPTNHLCHPSYPLYPMVEQRYGSSSEPMIYMGAVKVRLFFFPRPGDIQTAAGKTCIARIRLRSLDLAVGCTVHPGIRDVMRADWPYRAMPSVTSAYRCISVTVWSLPQRYFSYRHVITFGILLFLRLFRLPACRTDRTRV